MTNTPQEQAEVLKLFQSAYHQSRRIDSDIVNEASTLKRGKSEEIKRNLTSALEAMRPPAASPQPAPPVYQERHVQAIPAQQVIPANNTTNRESIDDNQLEFNFDLSEKQQLLQSVEGIRSDVYAVMLDIKKIKEELKELRITNTQKKRIISKVDNGQS